MRAPSFNGGSIFFRQVVAVVLEDVEAEGVAAVCKDLFLVVGGEDGADLIHRYGIVGQHAVLALLQTVQKSLNACIQRGAGCMYVLAQVQTDGAALHDDGHVHAVVGGEAAAEAYYHGIGFGHAVGHLKAETAIG